jgi:hypothetical protein
VRSRVRTMDIILEFSAAGRGLSSAGVALGHAKRNWAAGQ